MSKPIETVLLGAGDRGMNNFGKFALNNPQSMKIIAVAEANEKKRNVFAEQHQLKKSQLFESWEEVLTKPQMGEVLINATLDHHHYASTIKALDQGYHVLLEKPISDTPEHVLAVAEKAKRSDRVLQICFELRYAPFISKIKQLIDSKAIGELVAIEHKESLIYWHMAHSFVRGNWRSCKDSSPMLLAKACHDFDLLVWLVHSPCKKVSSFGGLNYFRKENAPPNAPDRCIEGCPHEQECLYSALKIYLNDNTSWPVSVISVDTSLESRKQALKEGPYGRCVFKCDNDVVDNQVVNLEFENGIRVAFIMTGHSHENTRTVRYSGTKGTLRGHFDKSEIEINYYNHNQSQTFHPTIDVDEHGHGGGDEFLLKDFVDIIKNKKYHQIHSSIDEAVESHMIIFAAEKSRQTNDIIELDKFKKQVQKKL